MATTGGAPTAVSAVVVAIPPHEHVADHVGVGAGLALHFLEAGGTAGAGRPLLNPLSQRCSLEQRAERSPECPFEGLILILERRLQRVGMADTAAQARLTHLVDLPQSAPALRAGERRHLAGCAVSVDDAGIERRVARLDRHRVLLVVSRPSVAGRALEADSSDGGP